MHTRPHPTTVWLHRGRLAFNVQTAHVRCAGAYAGRVPLVRPYLRPWTCEGQREQRIAEGAELVRFTLARPDFSIELRRRVVTEVLWHVTEVPSKFEPRFRSDGVLHLEDEAPLADWKRLVAHEHVVTRKSLAARLHAGEDPAVVLADSAGCLVTRDEHARLTALGDSVTGWERYRVGGIAVVDC